LKHSNKLPLTPNSVD